MIFVKLFLIFFEIGLFTFGGGYAMLPLVQSRVGEQGWISAEEFIDFVAVSESTPGPFAVNISTYVGTEVGGILGGLCATAGVVLPSFLVVLLIAKCYDRFQKSSAAAGVMRGLRPAVVGMIGAAVLSVGKTVFFGAATPVSAAQMAETVRTAGFAVSAAIFVIVLVLAFRKVHPITLIALSAAAGIAAGLLGIFPG